MLATTMAPDTPAGGTELGSNTSSRPYVSPPFQHAMPPLGEEGRASGVQEGRASGVRPLLSQQSLFGPEPGQEIFNAAMKLEMVQAVRVQEKRSLTEAFCGCEQNNTYTITDLQGKGLFIIKEDTTCWERQCFCLCPDWKPWRMDFFNIRGDGEGTTEEELGEHFLHLQRRCHIVCCCLCRPTVESSEPDGRVIGRLREPRTRCSYNYSVQDIGGNSILQSDSLCFQCGRFCCCPGFQVSFPIIDVSRNAVAEVRKTWTKGDCCPCCFSDWSKFVVEFGQAADAEYKLLLVSLAIVVQMRHFDTR